MAIADEAHTQVLTPPGDAPPDGVPRPAEGVELIGPFEDSGFKEPPYIARRADGQIVQMKPMLFALAEEIDGRRGYDEIARRFSERIERGVTPDMVETLVEDQLRPLGIVAPRDGEEQALKKVDPLLALKFRTKVVPERAVTAVTRVFAPLFHAPVVVAVVTAFVALDVWLFGIHGVAQSLRDLIYQPVLLLMLMAGVVAATAFHEIGHASACRFGGARPGVMGVGVYIVWPAMYTDITDAYRLDKRGRLRTDLGGMYFNLVYALGVAGLYALTRFEPLLLLVVLQNFVVIQQSLPLLRLDGYYVISDLTGVPDILLRMRSILLSVLPGRAPDERVTELKPWVRVVVTGYVLLLVPVLALIFAMLIVHAPRVFATAWDSFWVHWDRVGPAFDAGQTVRALTGVVQMAFLVLPAAGLAYTAARVSRRLGGAAWAWSAASALRRRLLVAGAALTAALTAFLWWPGDGYRPIQPDERGTLVHGVSAVAQIPSGRPVAPEPERAPAERERTAPGERPEGREPGDERRPGDRERPGAPSGDPQRPGDGREPADPGRPADDPDSGELAPDDPSTGPEQPEGGMEEAPESGSDSGTVEPAPSEEGTAPGEPTMTTETTPAAP